MSQNTTTALTVPGLTISISASFHVLPQRFHLSAKLGGTLRSQLALGGVPQQKQPLLLLTNHFLGISATAPGATIAGAVLLVHQVPLSDYVYLLLSTPPAIHHIVRAAVGAHVATHHVISIIERIHATIVIATIASS